MRNIQEYIGHCRILNGPLASTPEIGNYGAFALAVNDKTLLICIASDADDPVSEGWEHVSLRAADKHVRNGQVHYKDRTPTWDEMCFAKRAFFKPEETVVQFHPEESSYVNTHPHVLHLWRNRNGHTLPPTSTV